MRLRLPVNNPSIMHSKSTKKGYKPVFRDFRAMCSRLILQEKEEKEKWYTLCLKMMKERDTALQRISVLVSERETHLSPPPSSSSAAVPASSAQETDGTSKVSKRGRDESTSSAVSQEQLPSRSSPVELRPIRSLHLSPVSKSFLPVAPQHLL